MWYTVYGSISTREHKRFIGVARWNKPGVNCPVYPTSVI